jgi:peptidoglycan/xylan/chitin deacetylase (PgdA/CDA1 family)
VYQVWPEPVIRIASSLITYMRSFDGVCSERELMEIQLRQYAEVVGGRPRGYRAPVWDFSDATLGLLEEYGFEWDSSLMGREFEPYHPRPVTLNWEGANQFGAPSPY